MACKKVVFKMPVWFTIPLVFVLLPFTCLAQLDISGVVTSAGEPVSGVQIYISSQDQLVATDDEGVFEFKDVPLEPAELIAYKEGYQVYKTAIKPQETKIYNIQLLPLSQELTAVVLSQQRALLQSLRKLRDVEETAIYAGKKSEVVDIQQVSGNIAANNAREIYGKVAGLNIYDNGDAGLQLNIGGRGLDPNRTANFNVRQNGYDISADALGYPESYYTPPPEALDEIQIVRGAASLQYGPQFGGLINFKFKEPRRDTFLAITSRQSAGSFGLFTSFNSISGSKGKLGYYGYFHYKEGSNFRPNSGFNARNGYTHLDYQISDKTEVSIEATLLDYLAQQPGGLTDAQFEANPDFSNRERNWFKVEWLLLNAQVKHRFSDRTRASLSIFGLDAARKALGFRTNRVSQPDDPEEPRELLVDNFRNFGAEARVLTEYDLFERDAALVVGSKFYTTDNEQRQGPGSAARGPDFRFRESEYPNYARQSSYNLPNSNLAFFAENLFPITDKWTITPGLRYENITTSADGSYQNIQTDLAGNVLLNEEIEESRSFNRDFLLAGVGASFQPNRQLEFYGNFSQNYRSITFSDIRVLVPNQQVATDISDERGYTADIGLRGNGNLLSYDVSAFFLSYDDRIGEVLAQKERGDGIDERVPVGSLVRLRDNIGTAELYGVETFINWSLAETFFPQARQWKLAYFSNLTYTRGEYVRSERREIVGNQVEFIPEFNWRTGLDFGYKNLTGSVQYTYLSQQFTDATNADFDTDLVGNQRGVEGPIPAYGVVDFSLSYRLGRFTLIGGINNVLDEKYFTRRATGYPGPGIIPANPINWYTTLEIRL